MVDCIRATLAAGGIQTVRQDSGGVSHQRFGGRVLRVSGAQFLAAASVDIGRVMLLGRWSSSAIERYTQQAAVQALPTIPSQVLHGERKTVDVPAGVPSAAAPATPGAMVVQGLPVVASQEKGQLHELRSAHDSLEQLVHQMRADVTALGQVVPKPERNFVVRCKSLVAHLGMEFERENPPVNWRTRCGWPYGGARFFRVPAVAHPYRSCRKCFNLDDSSDDQGDEQSPRSRQSSSGSDSTASSADDL